MKDLPMQTVFIDVGDELNRMVAVANLMPTANLDVIENIMLALRDDADPRNAEGAKFVLDLTQAAREFRSASEAYSKYIIVLAKSVEQRDKPAGDASA